MGVTFISIGVLQNCCCCGNREELENDYVQLDEPESSSNAIATPDYQPPLPLYTKRDPRAV